MMSIKDITRQRLRSLPSFSNETINLAVTDMTAAEMFVEQTSHISYKG